MSIFKPTFANFKKDQFILVEGKKTENFYIIMQGKVRLTRDVSIDVDNVETLNPGDFFGVISTMSDHNQIETTQAMTDVVLIAVHKKMYQPMIQKSPQVAIKIITYFSKRLRTLNETLARLTLKSNADITPSHLFNVGEYYFNMRQRKMAVYAYNAYIKHCPDGTHVDTINKRFEEMKKRGPVNPNKEFSASEITRTYTKDTMLFAEGEPGEELFIIQSGSIKITKIVDNNEVMLAMLKTGDIFGEMALLEGKPRAANAIAYEDCTVTAISKTNFELMIQTKPQLIEKVTVLFAERIWFIYKQLLNTLLGDPIARMYDALYIQLEKNSVPMDSKNEYTFNFGKAELIKMVGLQVAEGMIAMEKMLKEESIQISDEKIKAVSVQELVKMTDYYRRMDKREKNKQQSKEARGNY